MKYWRGALLFRHASTNRYENQNIIRNLPGTGAVHLWLRTDADKAKLDQFFDRLAEKNKAMGSLVIAKDGKVIYTRAIGYSQINGSEKKALTVANRFRIASITKNVHCRDELAVRRGRKIDADRYPRQILPADSERQENCYRANTLASQRYP